MKRVFRKKISIFLTVIMVLGTAGTIFAVEPGNSVSGNVVLNEKTGAEYTSLTEAAANAAEGDTLKLLEDITLDSKVIINEKITIDLNGKSLNASSDGDWSSGVIYNEQSWKSYIFTIKNGTINLPKPPSDTKNVIGIYNHIGSIEAESLSVIYGGPPALAGQVTGIRNSGMNVTVSNCSFQVDDNGVVFLTDGESSKVMVKAGTFSKNPLSEDNISLSKGYIMEEANGMFVVKADEAAKISRDGADIIYTTLAEALRKAKAGEIVVLLKDVPAANEQFSIDKSMTLDLNGHSIGSVKEQTFLINKYGETIEVKLKNGTITNDSSEPGKLSIAVFARQRVKLYLENMKLTSNPDAGMMGYGLRIGHGDNNLAPEVTVSGADTRISGSGAGIALIGSGTYGNASLVLNDGSVTGGYYGIAGNGTFDGTDITVNGGAVKAFNTGGAAVYHPQNGNLTINGGTFEGSAGIQYLGEGKVSISGGTITAVDERVNPVIPSGDGAVRDGAAFSIISRGGEYGGAQGAEVSITGGTFISKHNIAVREYGADNLDTLVKTLYINQGEGKLLKVWSSAGQKAMQMDKMDTDEIPPITSGTFSGDVSDLYDEMKYQQNPPDALKDPGAVVPRSYKIIYDYAGGGLPQGQKNPGTYTYFDDEILLINPQRTGYEFAGWMGTGFPLPSQDVSIPEGSYGDRSYIAVWSAKEASIVFKVNGGSSVDNLTGLTDQKISDRSMPKTSKEGYIFTGWFDQNGKRAELLPEKFPAGTTVYSAGWKAVPKEDEQKAAVPPSNSSSAPKPKTGSSVQSKRVTKNTAKAGESLGFAGWAGVMLMSLICGVAAANRKKKNVS